MGELKEMEMEPFVGIAAVARHIGKSYQWVRTKTDEGLIPSTVFESGSKKTRLYLLSQVTAAFLAMQKTA